MKPAKVLICVILSLQVAFPAGAFARDSRQQLETASRVALDPVEKGALRQDDEKLDSDITNGNIQSTGTVRWNDEDWSLSGKRDKNPDLFKEKGSQLFSDFGKRTAKTELVVDPLRPTLFAVYVQEPMAFYEASDGESEVSFVKRLTIVVACIGLGILVGLYLTKDL